MHPHWEQLQPLYSWSGYRPVPAHLGLVDLITRILFGKEDRPCSSSLCSHLLTPVTLLLLLYRIMITHNCKSLM